MTESAAPSVAVVIPSWNSAGLLPRCLDSLRGQGEIETFVVDNGSTDGTVDLLRARGIPHLTLPENRGFAAAVNRAVAETRAPLVLPLNADTELEPGAVAAMVAALERDPTLGGVAPRILQVEGEARDVASARLYSAGQALTKDGRAVEIGAGEAQASVAGRGGEVDAGETPASVVGRGGKVDTGETQASVVGRGGEVDTGEEPASGGEVFGVCGAACLLRRELFTELGGYDESFFSFYEDVDLNVRARIAGWRFDYVPEAVVWHLGNASWLASAPAPGAWNARLVARNRIVTQARFMPAGALPRIVAVEAGALLRAARQGRLGATLRGKLEGLARLPRALRERRRLAASGDLARAQSWLGSAAAAE